MPAFFPKGLAKTGIASYLWAITRMGIFSPDLNLPEKQAEVNFLVPSFE